MALGDASDRGCLTTTGSGWVTALTPGPIRPAPVGFPVLLRRGHKLLLELVSRTDLIGSSFPEGFVYFDVDSPPYPARNTLHAGEDTYLKIFVRAT